MPLCLTVRMLAACAILAASTSTIAVETSEASALKAGVFAVDASPPVGSPLAYDPTKETIHPLSSKGIVLIGEEGPVVLCAIDWIGVANESQRVFREELAAAAGTTPDRVAVHALHQHDAPNCDFSAEEVLTDHGMERVYQDEAWARGVIATTAAAVKTAVANARPISHVGLGEGIVEKVASNRRVLDATGTKVEHVRYSSCTDPEVRAKPEGVIDPLLKMISLWDGEDAVAVLTFYATHPQSYYRTGLANPDFPGIARDQRQAETDVFHVHFNGAGGNITAGKYNDGSHENRQILADRVKAGMDKAWAETKKTPIASAKLGWKIEKVMLPIDPSLNEEELNKIVASESTSPIYRYQAAHEIAWLRRCQSGEPIDISCLVMGDARLLLMPGELFVEYQLAAQKMRPDLFVAMAAYGEYAPGYIGTEASYSQGGYETSRHISLVAPSVEGVLMQAMENLLRD